MDAIDLFLARSLSSSPIWPGDWQDAGTSARVVDRAHYHGVAGLLTQRRLDSWPDDVVDRLREQSVAQMMWEMRHRDLISGLVDGLAQAEIGALLLKGTALAYDLYDKPEYRARGDTDLLIAPSQLASAREILASLGFNPDTNFDAFDDAYQGQETWWIKAGSGMIHLVDLHWRTINFLALHDLLSFDECAASKRPLPLLGANAFTVDRPTALLHCCVHRAGHFKSPYIVDGRTYFGGDRLIWAKDIDLLAGAMTENEWECLCALAGSKGVAEVCLDSFEFARTALGTIISSAVIASLQVCAPDRSASAYLMRSSQSSRALQDLKAIPKGTHKLRYMVMRALPSPAFLRAKYPGMAGFPVVVLGLRRFVELFTRRLRQVAE